MTELHGFTHDEYVRYHDRLIAALAFAVVGVLTLILGQSIATDALVVREAGGWFTIDGDASRFLGGSVVSALGIMLASVAPHQYRRAKAVRESARHRYTAAAAATTAVASIVLELERQVRASEDGA